MKTHDLAKYLTGLAKILRNLPNQDFEEFGERVAATKDVARAKVGISLSTLAAFSNYSKSDWQAVIHDFELPIEIRQRDAARDVMGKILSYLAENNDERERIARKSQMAAQGSSELSTALAFLLKNG